MKPPANIALLTGSVDAVMVDLDGTLVDTLGDFVAALRLMLAELGLQGAGQLPIAAATVETMIGKGSEHLIHSALTYVLSATPRANDSPESLYPVAFDTYQRHYQRINGQHAQIYPGVLEGLSQWQAAGLPLACLTNKPVAFAKELLLEKRLDGFFAAVFGGDSFERKKPDPLPLLKACEALGTLPARTLMVGDSSNDARAARSAGCPVALVTYGYNHGLPIQGVDADAYIDALDALVLPTRLR